MGYPGRSDQLAAQLSGGRGELDPGQFNAANPIATRLFEVDTESNIVGLSTLAIDSKLSDASVEAIYRDGKTLYFTTLPSLRRATGSRSPDR